MGTEISEAKPLTQRDLSEIFLAPECRWGEREKEVARISIDQINLTNWYPLETEKLKKYSDAYFDSANAGEGVMGIHSPTILVGIKGENLYRVGDGFHRVGVVLYLAALNMGLVKPIEEDPGFVFEERVLPVVPKIFEKLQEQKLTLDIPAKVEEGASMERLWAIRATSLIGQHPSVRFSRFILFAYDEWDHTIPGSEGIDFPRAIRAARDNKVRHKTPATEDLRRAVDLLSYNAEKWEVGIETLYDYFVLSEKLHPNLWLRVRTQTQMPHALSYERAKILAHTFTDAKDWQLHMYELLGEKGVYEGVSFQQLCDVVRTLIPLNTGEEYFREKDVILLARELLFTHKEKTAREQIQTMYAAFAGNSEGVWYAGRIDVKKAMRAVLQKTLKETMSVKDTAVCAEKAAKLVLHPTGKPKPVDQASSYEAMHHVIKAYTPMEAKPPEEKQPEEEKDGGNGEVVFDRKALARKAAIERRKKRVVDTSVSAEPFRVEAFENLPQGWLAAMQSLLEGNVAVFLREEELWRGVGNDAMANRAKRIWSTAKEIFGKKEPWTFRDQQRIVALKEDINYFYMQRGGDGSPSLSSNNKKRKK